MEETIITGNGTVALNKQPWWSTTIIHVGDLGGATVELQAHNATIETLTSNSQIRIDHGSLCELSLTTTGHTSDISLWAYRL